MPALLVHPFHVGFVVLVTILQGLVAVFYRFLDLALLELLESGDGAQLIEDFMLLLQSKSGKEELEVIEEELPLSLLIDYSEKASHFFLGDFHLEPSDKAFNVLASDGFAIGADEGEDMCGVEIE